MSLLNFHAAKLYRQVRRNDVYDNDVYDNDGNYNHFLFEWEYCCDCDVVPAGEANKLTTPDGTLEFYSYTVSNLPVGIRKFEYGQFIKLVLVGGEEAVVKVKGFHRYQLQCKIWA